MLLYLTLLLLLLSISLLLLDLLLKKLLLLLDLLLKKLLLLLADILLRLFYPVLMTVPCIYFWIHHTFWRRVY